MWRRKMVFRWIVVGIAILDAAFPTVSLSSETVDGLPFQPINNSLWQPVQGSELAHELPDLVVWVTTQGMSVITHCYSTMLIFGGTNHNLHLYNIQHVQTANQDGSCSNIRQKYTAAQTTFEQASSYNIVKNKLELHLHGSKP